MSLVNLSSLAISNIWHGVNSRRKIMSRFGSLQKKLGMDFSAAVNVVQFHELQIFCCSVVKISSCEINVFSDTFTVSLKKKLLRVTLTTLISGFTTGIQSTGSFLLLPPVLYRQSVCTFQNSIFVTYRFLF